MTKDNLDNQADIVAQFLQQGKQEIADKGFSQRVSRRVRQMKILSFSINGVGVVIGAVLLLCTQAFTQLYHTTLAMLQAIDLNALQQTLQQPHLLLGLLVLAILGLQQLLATE